MEGLLLFRLAFERARQGLDALSIEEPVFALLDALVPDAYAPAVLAGVTRAARAQVAYVQQRLALLGITVDFAAQAPEPKPLVVTPGFDFSGELATGEDIISFAVAPAITDGYDPSYAYVIGSSSLTSPYVYVQLRAGVNGSTYLIKVTATTDQGKALVRKAVLPVIS